MNLIFSPVLLMLNGFCLTQLANMIVSQVFVLLVAEMALFVALIIPMPFTVKRKMFNFLAESPIVAKLQYGMKVNINYLGKGRRIADEESLDYIHIHSYPFSRQRQSGLPGSGRDVSLLQASQRWNSVSMAQLLDRQF